MTNFHRDIYARQSPHFATARQEKAWIDADNTFAIVKTGKCWSVYHMLTHKTVGSSVKLERAKELVNHIFTIAPVQFWQSFTTAPERETATPEQIKIFEECAKIRKDYK